MEHKQEIAELKARIARLEAQIARSEEAAELTDKALSATWWHLERWKEIERLVEHNGPSALLDVVTPALAAYKACKNFQQASDELEEASKRWRP